MSTTIPDAKLGMSLDDLISAEKKNSNKRERSPRQRRERRVDDATSKSGRSTKVILRPNRDHQTTVKVTNVPFDLSWKDIRSAFSEIGPVERCDVEDGVATVNFRDARDAQKAVKTYDGGEMNGRRIRASLI